jgi:pyruvate dehydrogenase E2 component (dihydrolipoamide acetyltransferase)
MTTATEEVKTTKLGTVRKIIARRMRESLANSAQLTLQATAPAAGILAARARFKAQGEESPEHKITLNDIICHALVKTLKAFPEINACFENDTISQYSNVNLSIAVDTRRGLMVPVIKNAETLSLLELSESIRHDAALCNKGTINPENFKNGSFTVTNLGALGIEYFTPILNTPQVAILGIGNITPRPVLQENGTYEFTPQLALSLTIDHAVIDGAPAAKFLKTLASEIEQVI